MKNMFGVYMLIFVIIGMIYIVCKSNRIENFMDGTNTCGFPSMMNAHGSEPAGFNASPGNVEKEQNINTEYVNPMNRRPKSVNSEYTEQP